MVPVCLGTVSSQKKLSHRVANTGHMVFLLEPTWVRTWPIRYRQCIKIKPEVRGKQCWPPILHNKLIWNNPCTAQWVGYNYLGAVAYNGTLCQIHETSTIWIACYPIIDVRFEQEFLSYFSPLCKVKTSSYVFLKKKNNSEGIILCMYVFSSVPVCKKKYIVPKNPSTVYVLFIIKVRSQKSGIRS